MCLCFGVCTNFPEDDKENTNNNQNMKFFNNPHKIEFEAQRDSFIKKKLPWQKTVAKYDDIISKEYYFF